MMGRLNEKEETMHSSTRICFVIILKISSIFIDFLWFKKKKKSYSID